MAVTGFSFGAASLVVWGILFIAIIVLGLIMPAAIATNWHSFLVERDQKPRQSSGVINGLFHLGLNSNVYGYLWTAFWLTLLAGAPILLLVIINDALFLTEVLNFDISGDPLTAFTGTGYLIFSMIWYVFVLARYGLVLPATAVETDEENDMTFPMAAKLSAAHKIPLFLALLVSLLPTFVLTSTLSPFTIQNMISTNQTSLNETRRVKLVSIKEMPSRVWVIVNLFGMLTVFSYIYLLMTLLPLAVLSHAYQQLYDEVDRPVLPE